MMYFAYASNLNPELLRDRCPGHAVIGLAVLHDYRLVFPRYSSHWEGGAAGLARAHGESVWGILVELTDDDLARLDHVEGWRDDGDHHNLYDRDSVMVDLVRPDDGSVPRRVRAVTYFARPLNPCPPSRRYLDTILAGARHHRLPDEYLEKLRTIEAASETS
jgi:hypothetical protein